MIVRAEQLLLFPWDFRKLNTGSSHLIPLIFNTEKHPLESPEHLQSSNCKHCQVVVAEMGRQFICPGAAQEEVASNYPKVYLQVWKKTCENERVSPSHTRLQARSNPTKRLIWLLVKELRSSDSLHLTWLFYPILGPTILANVNGLNFFFHLK